VTPAEIRARLDDLDREEAALRRARLDALRAEEEEILARHPLAGVVLWEPECPTCPDVEQMQQRPDGQDWHRGVTLEHLDGERHRCPSCREVFIRTSQRAAMAALLAADVQEGFLKGSNRSGKSVLGRLLCMIFALGAEHWSVQRFAAVNRLPLDRVQPGPGRVWACGQTFNAAREYVRPGLKEIAPHGSIFKAWDAWNEAELHLPNGGIIVSKAVEQAKQSGSGKNPFEGAAIHAAWFDEEPQVRLAVESTGMRLVDHRGPMFFTMTPLTGWTRFLTDKLGFYREGRPAPPGVVLRNLLGEHNPHIDARALLRKLSRLPPAVQRARRYGEIVALEGVVHGDFNRDLHVVQAFDPPADWPRFSVIDFGTRDPFVHLWAALDRRDDTLHVYREHYQREATLRTHAGAIFDAEHCPACEPDERFGDPWWDWLASCADQTNACEVCGGTGRADPEPEIRWADPANLDSRLTLNGEYCLPTTPAIKDRRVTLEALCDRLALDAEGRPHLLIHDTCSNTIREIEGLTWNERSKSELDTKGDDHAWDCLRYLCRGLQVAGYTRDLDE